MKNPITTKDLGALNELMIFEQWISTKFRMLYDHTDDEVLQDMFQNLCLDHAQRREMLFKYLQDNAKAGGKK